jgi:AAA15 family ATPase/GTPase
MLDSLYIKNYRYLKEFKINSLNRINLITGKNNTGKSTILEAIAIYAAKGDVDLIYQLLEERGENNKSNESNINLAKINEKIFSSMFTDRYMGFDETDAILIGCMSGNEKNISLRFIKYIVKTEIDSDGNTIKKVVHLKNKEEEIEGYYVGLEIKTEQNRILLPFSEDRPHRLGFRQITDNSNLQFIRTRNIDTSINGILFDKIALTDKEKYLIEALKIIEPLTERVAFVGETLNRRNAVIKLSGFQQVLPLQSMGDGINRIMTIILALLNAGNGFLLIDEFENGLHYTVQEQLWNIIFKLAPKLNTQVFVTTHSNDCIKGFGTVLNCSDNASEGKLIRLDREENNIKHVEFNAEELQVSNEQNIEIR